MKKKIYIGTSGYDYKWWKEKFYSSDLQIGKTRQERLLKKYISEFNSLEINNSFYKYPSAENIVKINNILPENFRICFKINQMITHYKKLKNIKDDLINFCLPLKILKEKLGCLLFQFPKYFKYNDNNLQRLAFLIDLENMLKKKEILVNTTRFAFEFRNETFYNDNIKNLFKINKWIFVIWHSPENFNFNNLKWNLAFFENFIDTSDTLYIRLHGTKGLYYGKYSSKQLDNVVDFIEKNKQKKIYIYFNNVDSSIKMEAIENSREMIEKIKKYYKNILNKP